MELAITLIMLIAIQAVLGLDNLLYISLESKTAPLDKQAMVRKWGIGLAMFLRIGLLFVLMNLIEVFQNPFLTLDFSWISGSFNLHSVIVLVGGTFIVYTATQEILHLLQLDEDEVAEPKSAGKAIALIVGMNVIFSVDSILSAMALTDVFWLMASAIFAGGLLMIWLADRVTDFLTKNRMFEVLGLFILLVVGIMLLSEGGHLAHLEFWGNAITPMSKTTFYFVIAVVIIVEIVQTKFQSNLIKRNTRKSKSSK